MEAQGSSFEVMDKHSVTAQWYRDFSKDQLSGQKPSAIVLFSAHWEEKSVTVHTGENPELLFDYYGFPPHTYELKYPASGAPHLAQRIISLLKAGQIPTKEEKARGWDHGVFIPLKLMFPEGDVPIVQVSLHSSLSPQLHLQIGELLTPLRVRPSVSLILC